MPSKSHVVGSATDSDGARTTAYLAVAEFVCVQCHTPIAPGQLFSRRARRASVSLSMHTLGAVPVCTTCRPLRVDEATDAPSPTDGARHNG